MKLNLNVDSDHKKRELEQNRILLATLEKYVKTSKRKGRRNKLKIYHDIMHAIQKENRKDLKSTRLQLIVETSYDKLAKYLEELEESGLIHKKPFSITERGVQFLIDYDKVMQHIEKNNI